MQHARIARGEALQALLVNELNHRVKNTLTTVQSIAAQTFRRAPDLSEATAKFEARLVALGHAHNVLSDGKWESADVRDIMNGGLEPFAGRDGDRLQTKGGEVRIAPRRTLMMSMVLHELATNATKHGAWSSRTGAVVVEWATFGRNNTEWLRFIWRETGGPPVRAPARKAFGSRLIEQGGIQSGRPCLCPRMPSGIVLLRPPAASPSPTWR